MKRVLIIPSCSEVHDGLTDFMEGVQPWHVRLGTRLHLLLCAACRALAEALRALPARVGQATSADPSAPPEARAALAQVLAALKRPGEGSPP